MYFLIVFYIWQDHSHSSLKTLSFQCWRNYHHCHSCRCHQLQKANLTRLAISSLSFKGRCYLHCDGIVVIVMIKLILTWRSWWPPVTPGASRGQELLILFFCLISRILRNLKFWKLVFLCWKLHLRDFVGKTLEAFIRSSISWWG